MKKHWSEKLQCNLCFKTFRSTSAEARHRHNAPLLCKPAKTKKKKVVPMHDGHLLQSMVNNAFGPTE